MKTGKKLREKTVHYFLKSMTYFIVLITAFTFLYIIYKGSGTITCKFLTTSPLRGGAEGGIFPAILGTLYLILGTIAVALPLGIASAIYLNEYATQGRLTRLIRLAIVTLAGVPSIVFGLFGLGLFVIFLRFGASILAGSLTLALMILPIIIVASEESLKAVPYFMREASLALGATRWQTIYKNVLPFSFGGMLTGSILGIGRAAGETAPILFTAAAFFLPRLPRSVFDQVMALPYHLYILATQHPEAQKIQPMQYGTALVLIILVLGLNFITMIIRYRMRKKYQW